MIYVLFFLGAYLLGSVPVGFLVGKARGVDLREVGSGNIGATNTLRTLGKGPGYFVFACDVLKGVIPAVLAKLYFHSNDWGFFVGIAAVFGHALSPFLGFKGGKGIATGLGVLLGSVTLVGLSSFGLFLFVMAFCLIVSLSSVIAAAALPFWGLLYHESPIMIGALCVMGIYLVSRHRTNFERLRQGTEPRFGQKTADGKAPNTKSRIVCLVLSFVFIVAAYLAYPGLMK
ncbi:MAG: glycerol-3-phosphate 1-O-acyltransferase PlsY [Fimbriimonadaceae bacterium]